MKVEQPETNDCPEGYYFLPEEWPIRMKLNSDQTCYEYTETGSLEYLRAPFEARITIKNGETMEEGFFMLLVKR